MSDSLRMGSPGDRWEREADSGDSSLSPARPENASRAPSSAIDALHRSGSGSPLPDITQRTLGASLGSDLSGVRTHVNPELNDKLGSRAVTVGQNIYTRDANPSTATLRHEVAHTVQQSRGQAMMQLQTGGGSTPAPIAVDSMFGLAVGAKMKVAIDASTLGLLGTVMPKVAAGLRNRTATVTHADSDLFEAVIDGTIPDPSGSGDMHDVTIQVSRAQDGTIELWIFRKSDPKGQLTSLSGDDKLTAARSGSQVTLSKDGSAHFIITPATAGNPQAVIEARPKKITGSFLAPKSATITLSPAPAAPQGTEEQKKVAEEVFQLPPDPRQSLSIGGGVSNRLDPLFLASWKYTFRPVPKAGTLLRMPLEAEIFYSPPSALIGGVTIGAESSLPSLLTGGKLPVTVRLSVGAGGGQVQGSQPDVGERETAGALGPIFGAGFSYERGWFRTEVRYDILWNVIGNGPNLGGGTLQVGGRF